MRKRKTLLQVVVKDELDLDPVIDDRRIDVEGDGSEIVLTGVVDVPADRLLAEEDALAVEGVTRVRDDLLIGPEAAHAVDEELTGRIRTALYEDPFVPPGSVQVYVEAGSVRLTGQVRFAHERRAAVRAVERVDGVLQVDESIVTAP